MNEQDYNGILPYSNIYNYIDINPIKLQSLIELGINYFEINNITTYPNKFLFDNII